MFAKQIVKDVKVGEDTVTVRKLSGKTLDKARVARRADQVQSMRDIGAELIKAFREGKESAKSEVVALTAAPPEPTPEELSAARRETFGDYDRDTVLYAGIVRWTAKLDGKSVPLNPEAIDDLTEEESKLIFDEILDLSVPVSNAAEVQGKG